MPGSDAMTGLLFSYLNIEARIPCAHPIWTTRRIGGEALSSPEVRRHGFGDRSPLDCAREASGVLDPPPIRAAQSTIKHLPKDAVGCRFEAISTAS